MTSIAIVNASGPYDGITNGLASLVSAVKSLGYDATYYQCIDSADDWTEPRDAVPIHGLPLRACGVGMGVNRLFIFPRQIKKTPEEICFLSDPTLVSACVPSRPSVVKVHDMRPFTPFADRLSTRLMFRFAIPRLNRASRVIVTTRYMREVVVAHGVDIDRIRIVPDTTDIGGSRKHLDLSLERIRSTGMLRVLCVSTDRPFKNVHFFIQLAQAFQACDKGGSFQFTLVSRLGQRNESEVRKLHLPNLRVVSGLTSMAPIYAENDVLVSPSSYEGFGRPLIEAMSCGLPVVSLNRPEVPEVLGGSGIVLPDLELESWVSTLRSLLGLDVYRELASHGYDRSRQFGFDQFVKALATAIAGL